MASDTPTADQIDLRAYAGRLEDSVSELHRQYHELKQRYRADVSKLEARVRELEARR